MEYLKTQQMLDAQNVPDPQLGPDPYGANASMVNQVNQLQGAPIDPTAMQKTQLQTLAPVQNQIPVTPASLFKPANRNEKTDFSQSEMPKMLQKLGVNDKGLALNQLGKLQLITRLKNRFGLNYDKNPDALKILNTFEQSLSQNDPEKQQAAISSGERTLQAIYGGKA